MPRIPKRQERALGRWRGFSTHRRQDSTGHDIGLKTSKSSSLSEEPDIRILRGYCGAKEFGNLGPFDIKPKAQAEEEEMSEDERRRFKLPGAGQSCLQQIKITEGKSSTSPKAASQSVPRESTSAMSQPWEYGGGEIQGEIVTSALNAHN